MIWIGTSGWSYEHWTGVLYPPRLPPRERLATYVRHFRTVEVNSTFYRWPRPSAFAGWRRRLPEGFALAVKAPRGLTHGARLYAPERWIERIVQMPNGIPVATVAIGGALNAGLLAVKILAAHDPALLDRMIAYMEELATVSRAKNERLGAV